MRGTTGADAEAAARHRIRWHVKQPGYPGQCWRQRMPDLDPVEPGPGQVANSALAALLQEITDRSLQMRPQAPGPVSAGRATDERRVASFEQRKQRLVQGAPGIVEARLHARALRHQRLENHGDEPFAKTRQNGYANLVSGAAPTPRAQNLASVAFPGLNL